MLFCKVTADAIRFDGKSLVKAVYDVKLNGADIRVADEESATDAIRKAVGALGTSFLQHGLGLDDAALLEFVRKDIKTVSLEQLLEFDRSMLQCFRYEDDAPQESSCDDEDWSTFVVTGKPEYTMTQAQEGALRRMYPFKDSRTVNDIRHLTKESFVCMIMDGLTTTIFI